MPTLDPHLKRLETAGLVRVAQLEPELEYLFRHALVHDAAYQAMLRQDRRALHQSVGETLESLYPDRLDELAPQLGAHFAEAGDNARALRYLTLAGDAALSRYANAEAILHYSRAIEIALASQPDRGQLLHLFGSRGRAQELNARYDDALANYQQLEAIGQAGGDASLELAAIMSLATIHSTFTPLFNPDRGIELSNRALALAARLGDEAAQAKIHWNLLLAYRSTSQLAPALEHGEKSLEIARRLNLTEQLAYTLHDISGIYLPAGQIDKASSAAEEARGLWRALHNQAMLADNLATSSEFLGLIGGRAGEAQRLVEEAIQIARSIGNQWGEAYGLIIAGNNQRLEGHIGEALRLMEAALPVAEAGGFGFPLTVGRLTLAQIYLNLGQGARAQAYAEAAVRAAEQMMPALVIVGRAAQALVAASRGDLEQADRLLTDTQMPESVTDPNAVMAIGPVLAEVRRIQGRSQEALDFLDGLAAQFPPALLTGVIPACELWRVRARLLSALGRDAEARDNLLTGLRIIDTANSDFQRWETLAALAEVEQTLGNKKQAVKVLKQARRALDGFIQTIGDPALEASFRARPEVANVMGGR